jgi:RNA polymerase sigma factor (sigma-70 family)
MTHRFFLLDLAPGADHGMPMHLTTMATRWTLILKAASGSRQALEEMARQYRGAIVNYFRAKGRPDEAEDLTGEVFKVLLSPGVLQKLKGRAPGSFRPFLKSIAFHTLSHWRRSKGRRGEQSLEEMVGEAFDPAAPEPQDRQFDYAFGKELGRQAMELFTVRATEDADMFRWEVIRLHVGEGMTVAQVAQKMGRTEREVKTDLQTGLRQLRDIAKHLIRQSCATQESLDEEHQRFLKSVEGWE